MAKSADVSWGKLWVDLALLIVGVLVVLVSFFLDWSSRHADWFPRSGAVAVLLSGIVAYRSLTKHYQKFYNDTQRGYPVKTSPNQASVDYLTLGLSILGTSVWGYGDKALSCLLNG